MSEYGPSADQYKRSVMDIIDGRAVRAVWRAFVTVALTLMSVLAVLGQEARGDIKDLKQLLGDLKIQMTVMLGADAVITAATVDLSRRTSRLEDWRNSIPFRSGNP